MYTPHQVHYILKWKYPAIAYFSYTQPLCGILNGHLSNVKDMGLFWRIWQNPGQEFWLEHCERIAWKCTFKSVSTLKCSAKLQKNFDKVKFVLKRKRKSSKWFYLYTRKNWLFIALAINNKFLLNGQIWRRLKLSVFFGKLSIAISRKNSAQQRI